MRANKAISIVTAILVFLVALGSFALSYNALQDLATRNGITGWLSYIWPLLIDLALIVFSLSVVTAYLQSEDTKKQWALVGVYTIATIGFNIAHAPGNLQAQIVAAIAPVSLFCSFELLMSQLRTTVKRHGITQNITQLQNEVSQKQSELAQLDGQIDTLQAQSGIIWANDTIQTERTRSMSQANDTRQIQIAERRERVLTLTERGMSQGEIANELGVSIATIKRDTRVLNGKVSHGQTEISNR